MKKRIIGAIIGGLTLGMVAGYGYGYFFNRPSVDKMHVDLEYQTVTKVNEAVDKGDSSYGKFDVDEVFVKNNVKIDHPLTGYGYHKHSAGDKILIGKIKIKDLNGNINEYYECLSCYDVENLLEE